MPEAFFIKTSKSYNLDAGLFASSSICSSFSLTSAASSLRSQKPSVPVGSSISICSATLNPSLLNSAAPRSKSMRLIGVLFTSPAMLSVRQTRQKSGPASASNSLCIFTRLSRAASISSSVIGMTYYLITRLRNHHACSFDVSSLKQLSNLARAHCEIAAVFLK